MTRTGKIRTLTVAAGLSAVLAISGCSSDGATDSSGSGGDTTSSASADPSSSASPGEDGGTMRFVFSVLGKVGTPPNPDATESDIPDAEVAAAAEQLRKRFEALGVPDAVSVEGKNIVVQAANVGDELMYVASLAALNMQLRPIQAVMDGDGDFTPKQEPGAITLLSTKSLTQTWIDDVANRNCIDPTKMSMATFPGADEDYVAYCVPLDFVRSGGGGPDNAAPAIDETQKVIFGPALVSNTDFESVVPGSDGESIEITLTPEAKEAFRVGTERLAGLSDCSVAKETPTLQQVQSGCNEMAVMLDGIALTLVKVEQANDTGEIAVPLTFVAWEPRLIAEAAGLFAIEPLQYAFQRIE